jgi:hypothetical protein
LTGAPTAVRATAAEAIGWRSTGGSRVVSPAVAEVGDALGELRGVHEPAREGGRRGDAVSSGTAVECFAAALMGAGAEVVGGFVLVDMREVADTVTSVAAALPTQSVST